MAWPDDLSEISTNMPEEEFTLVRFALDHELVEWGESSLFISLGMADFIFNGHAYSLEESFEVITTINRKE
jgi:hypothetical protein